MSKLPDFVIRIIKTKKEIREYVFNRDGNKCLLCGSSDNLTLDHIIPKSKGGRLSLGNCQTLCMTCNKAKGDRKGNFIEKKIKVVGKIHLPEKKKKKNFKW